MTLQVSNCIACKQGLRGVTPCADNPVPPQNAWQLRGPALCETPKRTWYPTSSSTPERQLDGEHRGRRNSRRKYPV